jgi:nucleoside triphosphate diphosphatase
MEQGPGARFQAFVELIARLRAPGGCPWDREQTHRTVKPLTIEEAYEVAEAIDEGDDPALTGELGDLLLQVVFHAQIATDERRFSIAEVIAAVSDKMVRRHPHVFAGASASTPGEVLRNWEALKQEEQAGKQAKAGSMLDSVSRGLPAVMEAFQVTTKAARVGFDWPDPAAVFEKLDEEVAELRAAVAQPGSAAPAGAAVQAVESELGDLLFVMVNLARSLGVDPESSLKGATRKFRRRFRYIEERLRERGRQPADSNLDEMDALWQEAKRKEAEAGA